MDVLSFVPYLMREGFKRIPDWVGCTEVGIGPGILAVRRDGVDY